MIDFNKSYYCSYILVLVVSKVKIPRHTYISCGLIYMGRTYCAKCIQYVYMYYVHYLQKSTMREGGV